MLLNAFLLNLILIRNNMMQAAMRQCFYGENSSRSCLTRPFHHDRGRLVFAVSPRRGEQGALGRRLRRGQPFIYNGITAND
jgi:hypothetical protein